MSKMKLSLWNFSGAYAIIGKIVRICCKAGPRGRVGLRRFGGRRQLEERNKAPMIAFFSSLFQAEKAIKQYRREEQWRQVRTVTIFTIAAFLVMSALNIYERSWLMLVTTLGAALLLFLCLKLGKLLKKNTIPIEAAFFLILLTLFTYYVLYGGNNGFAILWVVFIPFLYMTMMNVKLGLVLSVYFLLLLALVFYGPLERLLHYDDSPTLRLRFPALFLIDFLMSLYCVQRVTLVHGNLIATQEKLKEVSFLDATTGLQNRAAYSSYLQTAKFDEAGQLAVVFIDVNGLHELNNTKGHKAGDAMLQLVGRYCTEQFPQAQVFRLGGDEFLLIIQRMEHCKVTEGMEELDRRVQAAGYSIAYGVEFRRSCFNLEDMTNCADNKMLGAKAEHYKQFDRRRH